MAATRQNSQASSFWKTQNFKYFILEGEEGVCEGFFVLEDGTDLWFSLCLDTCAPVTREQYIFLGTPYLALWFLLTQCQIISITLRPNCEHVRVLYHAV